MKLTDIFTYGKWEGSQLMDVIEEDPRYIEWSIEHVELELDDDAYDVYDAAIKVF